MVALVIKNSYTVVPAEPTPNGPLSLSEFDQRQPWTLAKTLYVYKPNCPVHDAADSLRTSLSRALVPFYPLAGRVRWIGGGRLEIDCNAMGAELVVAESDSTMEHFGDFYPTPKINDLLPAVDYYRPIQDLPVLTVRLTKFACGGLTVGVGLSHTAVDGVSALSFVSSWSKLARGENLPDNETPFLDRNVFVQEATSPARNFDHVEYKPLPVLMGRSDCEEERAKESTVTMLKLTGAQVKQLKKTANAETRDPPYSRFESITAHVWRCACKARELCSMQPTVVRLPVDCRDRLKPPCPRRYFGNTIMVTITDPTSCLAGELVSKPLGFAAEKLRKAIEKCTAEYIWSALRFFKSQEDISMVRTSFHIVGSKAGQFLGNPNLSVTSWINLPIHDADFGWGKPIYMGPGALVSDGKCFILPSCEEDGSLVLALRLQTVHMEVFKKLFYQEIDEIFK